MLCEGLWWRNTPLFFGGLSASSCPAAPHGGPQHHLHLLPGGTWGGQQWGPCLTVAPFSFLCSYMYDLFELPRRPWCLCAIFVQFWRHFRACLYTRKHAHLNPIAIVACTCTHSALLYFGVGLRLGCGVNCLRPYLVESGLTCIVVLLLFASVFLWSCPVEAETRGESPSPISSQGIIGPPTQVAGRCVAGARCTQHGATPARHRPDRPNAGTPGRGWCTPYGTILLGEDCGSGVVHLVAPPIEAEAQYLTPHLVYGAH